MEEMIACSNESEAIKQLHRILPSKFGILEDDLEIRIGHTSHIYLIRYISFNTLCELKSYCKGYVDGYER